MSAILGMRLIKYVSVFVSVCLYTRMCVCVCLSVHMGILASASTASSKEESPFSAFRAWQQRNTALGKSVPH